MYYHKDSESYIRPGEPFTINEVQYPSNWLMLATPEDKQALGLEEVVTVGQPADARYYWVSEELVGAQRVISNTPKEGESLANVVRDDKLTAIADLEKQITERRYREALLSGDHSFIQGINDQVDAIRATL